MNTITQIAARREAQPLVRIWPLAALLLAAGLLAGCNTVEGMGEDIRDAGDAIDNAAEDAN